MSWQVGAFGLLAVALLGGFVWYERTRPDARIVALVGTLAAFAALGRIAFAAVPNVKPTTDIVLIAGYALGGGPGFAVGALAGLTSNFFFGQGPWTPWQMAAWGATGVIGAGLAWAMTVRRGRDAGERGPVPVIGRWPLAIVCCVVGFAFTAFQDVGDWVTYSDHSLGALGLYVGQGLGFDLVHAAGCVVFALAIGPALIRSVRRFAQRLQVTWVGPPEAGGGSDGGAGRPTVANIRWAQARQETHAQRGFLAEVRGRRRLGVAALVTVAALAVATQRAHANPTAPSSATGAAASYLLSAENVDGGFGQAPGQASDPLYTGWAALGLAAAGHDLNRIPRLIAYMQARPRGGDVGALERTILVVGAAGQSARNFAGHDLVAALEGRVRRDGSVSQQVNLTAFAVLALRSAGVSGGAVTRAQRWLAAQQDRDGGFNFAVAGGLSDVDDTGAALEALAGDGAAGGVRAQAVAFLRRQQDRDGGFPSQPGTGSNAQSTAWAIQGLEAAGVSPASFHRGGAPSPLAYLVSLTGANGVVRYSRGMTQTPVWVTGEALMAMAGKPLPVAAPPAPSAPAPAAPHRASRTATVSRPAHAARPREKPAASHAAARPATAPAGPDPASIQRLAGAAGVLTALLLAPVGVG
jgi:Prenyltransferase and squalene oxidase repeat